MIDWGLDMVDVWTLTELANASRSRRSDYHPIFKFLDGLVTLNVHDLIVTFTASSRLGPSQVLKEIINKT